MWGLRLRVTPDIRPFPGHPSMLTLEETENVDKWRNRRKEMKKNIKDPDLFLWIPLYKVLNVSQACSGEVLNGMRNKSLIMD